MAQNQAAEGFAALIVMVIMIVGGLYFESTRPVTVIIILIVVIIGVVMWTWAAETATKESAKAAEAVRVHEAAMADADRTIEAIVTEHLTTLSRRRSTLVRVDQYGVVDGKDWNKEVQHFADKVILPKLSSEQTKAVVDAGMSGVFQRHIENRVADYEETLAQIDKVPEGISPIDFEGLCAKTLRSEGWEASTTKGSGDQGADVLARKNGRQLVIQCKLYTGTIGNKAVQEVIAAKQFYRADAAAVVSTTMFTRSAVQLAQASGVAMLHFSELRDFARKLDVEAA